VKSRPASRRTCAFSWSLRCITNSGRGPVFISLLVGVGVIGRSVSATRHSVAWQRLTLMRAAPRVTRPRRVRRHRRSA
jgi:hypothetical protein